ncbi:hypothetical protein SAMN02745219_02376 [Desulfofundulus thermosubterraneus DSM 16057]|uniref:Uncharacterized protein n=1 Tax=Desulfofundulus thermosubterraneus DSM 16057 TaxID=1121432 RepID=A0A1M6IN93_9FIRM|nr:hypothetical protein SAMN02745219_02376 [Desulfofundulus thermosubterraneus DSM 16057]
MNFRELLNRIITTFIIRFVPRRGKICTGIVENIYRFTLQYLLFRRGKIWKR